MLLNSKKLTIADLIQIFDPKFRATLKHLKVFKTFEFSNHVAPDHLKNLCTLIVQLTSL